MFPEITHIIYDMDGLLLATESIHKQVNQTIAQRYGKTYDSSLKAKVTGRTTLDSARILVESLQLPLSVEHYLQERNALIYQLYPQCQPLPGALTLTKHFYQHGIPQAIATSSSRKHFQMKTVNHQQWISLFERIIFGDDGEIKQGKPAPDIFLLAAHRMGAIPEQCLVFEDSLAGMEAALAAGMSVVVVPDIDSDRSLFFRAAQILDSLEDFQPELWHLPSFI